jgi:GDPmannose 4,6-dehydratase
MSKVALITGITGQDGAYLAQFLLSKDYIVYGAYRRTSSLNFWRVQELGVENHPNLKLVEYDLTDLGGTISLIDKIHPDEIYNLAAQSFVGVSFDQPVTTSQINALGALHLLEAVRIVNKKIRFYQASTSEMFGKVQEVPQTEKTPFYPRSPYGVSKLFAHWITINYRENYDIFGATGILFNHESPLRGKEFVTRKITDAVARIKLGSLDFLEIGNLNAKRDWGFAKDYVEGMWKMLQIDKPDNFVLATGKTSSIRDFLIMAFKVVDINIEFIGADLMEEGINASTGKVIFKVNPHYYRPSEVDLLIGNAAKAKEILEWESKTELEELCTMMTERDLYRNKIGFQY